MPTTVSIGPLDAANPNLDSVDGQQLKSQALHHLFDRSQGKTTLQSLIQFLKARLFHAQTVDLSSDEFVKMMLLDSCFILALLTKNYLIPLGIERGLLLPRIQQDLLLFENQLPLFVLAYKIFRRCALKFFKPILPYHCCNEVLLDSK